MWSQSARYLIKQQARNNARLYNAGLIRPFATVQGKKTTVTVTETVDAKVPFNERQNLGQARDTVRQALNTKEPLRTETIKVEPIIADPLKVDPLKATFGNTASDFNSNTFTGP